MSRKVISLATLIAAAVLSVNLAYAGTAPNPDLSGSWQMDSAKSHFGDGRSMTFVIQQHDGSMKLDGSVLAKDGNKTELHLNCKVDGSDCVLMEGAHKSKVSMWTVSGVLTICKTEGPTGDASNEWHIKLNPDGNSLSMDVEYVDPTAPLETVVFTKKAAE